jgi:hypothetical protein
MASKTKYPTDKERGTRSITQITNTPAGQLNDEELCYNVVNLNINGRSSLYFSQNTQT